MISFSVHDQSQRVTWNHKQVDIPDKIGRYMKYTYKTGFLQIMQLLVSLKMTVVNVTS